MAICTNCGQDGTGKFCADCAQPLTVKRITLSTLLHEVFHFFTHVDKGLLYTLKQLAIHPGHMQKKYLQGERSRHQKPFSMYFICATVAGVAIYLMSRPDASESSPFEEMRLHYYRHYYVITQAVLLPLYTLVNWLLFRNKDFNYAEAFVLFVYSLAFLLIMVIFVNALNLLPIDLDTEWVEVPLLALYITWTNLNFFNAQPVWVVILKSIASLLICWFTSYFVTEQIIRWMM